MVIKYQKIITFLFSVATMAHVFYLGYNLFNPDLPEIEISDVKLEDIDFPVIFKICLYDLQDTSQRYKNLGYGEVDYFFSGYNADNNSLIGWNGFGDNGEPIGTVEGKIGKKVWVCIKTFS